MALADQDKYTFQGQLLLKNQANVWFKKTLCQKVQTTKFTCVSSRNLKKQQIFEHRVEVCVYIWTLIVSSSSP